MAFTTEDAKVLMPKNLGDGMIKDARDESVVAQLSGREPQRFGTTEYITFNDFPKAEFVDEGAEKSGTSAGFGSVRATPKKAQVTMRFSEEVQWADEDYQIGILREVADAGAIALGRALDLGLIHRINPLSGTPISSWTNYLNANPHRVMIGSDDPDVAIRNAVGHLIGASRRANGIAIDPKMVWDLSGLQVKSGGVDTGQLRYPQIGLGSNALSDFQGLRAAQGDTVSGVPEASDTGIRAIVGDFINGIRWGVQRQLPVEIIRFGDPDGEGDLKRKNEIALRLEIVYGWYVFSDRFTVVDEREVTSLALTADGPTTIPEGDSVQLVATATFGDGTTADVTSSATDWASSAPGKVSVSGSGLATAKDSTGEANITAKFGGKTSPSLKITCS